VAALCDALLIIVAAMPPFISAARRWGTITDSGASMDGLPGLVAMFAGLCWALLYYIVFEGVLGATPGKFMLGLRVRGPDGQRAGFAPIAVRNLLRIIDGFAMYLVGLLVAALSKQRQRIGDHVAKTIVVDAGPGKAAPRGVEDRDVGPATDAARPCASLVRVIPLTEVRAGALRQLGRRERCMLLGRRPGLFMSRVRDVVHDGAHGVSSRSS